MMDMSVMMNASTKMSKNFGSVIVTYNTQSLIPYEVLADKFFNSEHTGRCIFVDYCQINTQIIYVNKGKFVLKKILGSYRPEWVEKVIIFKSDK